MRVVILNAVLTTVILTALTFFKPTYGRHRTPFPSFSFNRFNPFSNDLFQGRFPSFPSPPPVRFGSPGFFPPGSFRFNPVTPSPQFRQPFPPPRVPQPQFRRPQPSTRTPQFRRPQPPTRTPQFRRPQPSTRTPQFRRPQPSTRTPQFRRPQPPTRTPQFRQPQPPTRTPTSRPRIRQPQPPTRPTTTRPPRRQRTRRPPTSRPQTTRQPTRRQPTTPRPQNPLTSTTTTAAPRGRQIPSRADVDNVRAMLQGQLNRNSNLIPGWVQLGFHSCVGGCDGCIDFTNPSNRGLEPSYDTLRNLHRTNAPMMSLADFVNFAAVEAANRGIRQAGGTSTVPIRFGRTTCQNPDRPRKGGRFPSGNDPNAINVLAGEFRLSRQEAISLLGAHSLGRCRRNNQGFEGPWDNSPSSLDNGYWTAMLGTTWVPVRAPGGSTQWVPQSASGIDLSRSTPNIMMLHADIALMGQFQVSGGQDTPSCDRIDSNGTGCPASRDIGIVTRYSGNQNDFHRDFITAYVKMLENTRDTLQTV